MLPGNDGTRGLRWAQRQPPPPDAGRELQALLRWKYSPGWLKLRTLRDSHRRLHKFTMPQLEFAVRNSRHRGDLRFHVDHHGGSTIISLRAHLRRPHRERTFGGASTRGSSWDRTSISSSMTSDTDRTTIPHDVVDNDEDSSTAWAGSSTRFWHRGTASEAENTTLRNQHQSADVVLPRQDTTYSLEPTQNDWRATDWSYNQDNSWWNSTSNGSR